MVTSYHLRARIACSRALDSASDRRSRCFDRPDVRYIGIIKSKPLASNALVDKVVVQLPFRCTVIATFDYMQQLNFKRKFYLKDTYSVRHVFGFADFAVPSFRLHEVDVTANGTPLMRLRRLCHSTQLV